MDLGLALGVGIGVCLVAGVFRVGRPEVEVVDIGRWVPVGDERIDVVTTVRVRNLHPLLSAISGRVRASYHIDLNGVRLATGEKDGIDIDPGSQSVELQTAIHHENIPELWAAYVESDESITLTTSGYLSVGPWGLVTIPLPSVEEHVLPEATPVIDALASAADGIADSYELNTGSIIRDFTAGLLDFSAASPRVGYKIVGGRARWEEVTAEETVVTFEFVVKNSGDMPIPSVPEALNVTLEMNDVTMFTARGKGATLVDATEPPLAPGERRRVEYPVVMDNRQVDAWFRSHVRNDERTELNASVQLVFSPMILNAKFKIPPGSVPTVTCDIQTGILVDQETKTTCRGPGAGGF